MSLRYSDNKTFDVDFTCSTEDVSALYNQLVNDFKLYLDDRVLTFPVYNIIVIKPVDPADKVIGYSIITLNKEYGFGFFVVTEYSLDELNELINSNSFADLITIFADNGQSDHCGFGSVQFDRTQLGDRTRPTLQLTTKEYIDKYLNKVDHSYGFDPYASRLRPDEGILPYLTDHTSSARPMITYRTGDYWSKDAQLAQYSINLKDASSSHAADTRSTKFRLPRYCYGRVTYSIMTKDNGSWALYIHQTRPRTHSYNYTDDRRDFKPDSKRYGVVSVMFSDESSGVSAWIMPQGPQPIKRQFFNSTVPRGSIQNLFDHHWAILAFTHDVSSIASSYNDVAFHANFKQDLNSTMLDNSKVFNDSNNKSIVTRPLQILTTSHPSETITIDPDIMLQADIVCSSQYKSPREDDRSINDCDDDIISPLKNYIQLSEDSSLIRRKRQSDNSVWEFGGYGFIHRVS